MLPRASSWVSPSPPASPRYGPKDPGHPRPPQLTQGHMFPFQEASPPGTGAQLSTAPAQPILNSSLQTHPEQNWGMETNARPQPRGDKIVLCDDGSTLNQITWGQRACSWQQRQAAMPKPRLRPLEARAGCTTPAPSGPPEAELGTQKEQPQPDPRAPPTGWWEAD